MTTKTWTETPEGSDLFEEGVLYEYYLPPDIEEVLAYDITAFQAGVMYGVQIARDDAGAAMLNVWFSNGTGEAFPAVINIHYQPRGAMEEISREPYSGLRTVAEYTAAARSRLMKKSAWPVCRKCHDEKTLILRQEQGAQGAEMAAYLVCRC